MVILQEFSTFYLDLPSSYNGALIPIILHSSQYKVCIYYIINICTYIDTSNCHMLLIHVLTDHVHVQGHHINSLCFLYSVIY